MLLTRHRPFLRRFLRRDLLILDFATTLQNKTTIVAVTTAPSLFQLTDKHLANDCNVFFPPFWPPSDRPWFFCGPGSVFSFKCFVRREPKG